LLICGLTIGCAWAPGFARQSADESNRLITQARQACDRGDHASAQRLLARAAQVAPDDPEIQRSIGQALLLAGQRDEGLKHLRYAIQHGAGDPDAYLELAHVQMDAGRYDDCQQAINAALALVPTHTQAQLMNGHLAELRLDNDAALAIYYRLLSADPSDSETAVRAAAVLVRQKRTWEAAPMLRAVVDSDRISPTDQAQAHWLLGVIYGSERRWSEAAVHLVAAAALQSDFSADQYYKVAYACWETRDAQKARQFAARALALEPEHADAQALLAACRAADSPTQASHSTGPMPSPRAW
jgi:tetratricopeptide (TPR) repeat protein